MEYEFEELKILGPGLMAFGIANLASAGRDYPGEFYVRSVILTGGIILRQPAKSDMGIEAQTFRAIAAVIESNATVIGKDAELAWAEKFGTRRAA